MREENSGEEGLLAEVIEGDGDKQKIVAKTVKARLKASRSHDSLADSSLLIESTEDEQPTDKSAALPVAARGRRPAARVAVPGPSSSPTRRCLSPQGQAP